MIEDQLRYGIALAKAGNKKEARNVLSQFVKRNPNSELGWLWLASVVENEDQRCDCLEKALQLNPQNEAVRRHLENVELDIDNEKKPIVSPAHTSREKQDVEIAKELKEASTQYFVGHQLTREIVDDLRPVVARVFGPLGYEPYYADRVVEGQSLLSKICQKIYLTSFGIYDLSSPNPNVYLEIGIALGLNKPIIAIAKEETSLPPILTGYGVITFTGLADLENKLATLRDQGFPQTSPTATDYCHYCGIVCKGMSTPKDENSYLVLENSRLLWRDFMRTFEPYFSKYHLNPIYLTESSIGPVLCNVRRKILSCQFSICGLGNLSNETSFLALGMAIGSYVPWLVLSKRNHDPVPSNLQGFDRIEYTSLTDLESDLPSVLEQFLKMIVPQRFAGQIETETISLPFWMNFEKWVASVTHTTHTHKDFTGQIRMLRYEANKLLGGNIIPRGGLLIGRSNECDVIVASQMVSSQQFRIIRRDQRYFIEDLHSRNGTYLNGHLLRPGEPMEISMEDIIIIHGARFVIWDESSPLPEKDRAQPTKGTDWLTPPVERIEIPDFPPPPYLSEWNQWVKLVALSPDGQMRVEFEVQAYYPMGRILSELVISMKLPGKRYHFLLGNKVIDDKETPLSLDIKPGTMLEIFAGDSEKPETPTED